MDRTTLSSDGQVLGWPRIYARIASKLRDQILSGEYRPLARLPAERELCSRFEASRGTIRRALRILQEERLIYRRQGSGAYVAPNPSRRIPVMLDYTGSMRDHAPTARRTVIAWKWTPAEEWVAETLKIDRGDLVLYAERVDTMEGKAVACDRAYISRSFAGPLTEKHLSRLDFTETWMRVCRFRVERCRQIVEADAARGAVALQLQMRPRQPVLKSTEIYSTFNDRPAGVFVSYYHPGHVCISSNLRWTDHAE